MSWKLRMTFMVLVRAQEEQSRAGDHHQAQPPHSEYQTSLRWQGSSHEAESARKVRLCKVQGQAQAYLQPSSGRTRSWAYVQLPNQGQMPQASAALFQAWSQVTQLPQVRADLEHGQLNCLEQGRRRKAQHYGWCSN